MANKDLFKAADRGPNMPAASAVNEAGGKAYSLSDKAALALYVSTSCLNGTFYTDAQGQLDTVKKLLTGCDPEFIGKLAVYGRQKSLMKDLPALLCAHLAGDNGSGKGPTTPEQKAKLKVLAKVFPHVIDSGKMVRNFVQMIRSGVFGRKSLGFGPQACVKKWFDRSPASIFHQSIGQNPSMGQVIKLARPKPDGPEKAALFAYLCGSKVEPTEDGGRRLRSYYKDKNDGQVKIAYEQSFDSLPDIVKQFEAWKADQSLPVPKLNFRFLDGVGKLTPSQWTEIASQANWLTTLNSMNAYKDHGVFDMPGMADLIAQRLADPEAVAKARVFPYQILIAYMATEGNGVPAKVRDALHDALEAATKNVPEMPGGQVYICPDVSGSMTTARVTGQRQTGTDSRGKTWDTSTKARCIDVAALFSASLLRTNRSAEILPFEVGVVPTSRLMLEARDTVMTNARKLASIGGGGTNCSAPLNFLNQRNAMGDLVVFISDYESWFDGPNASNGKATEMMKHWQTFKGRNPKAKLVCIDLTPRTNSQVVEREDILQVGGFSDNVFSVVSRFAEGGWSRDFWVKEIEKIDLDGL